MPNFSNALIKDSKNYQKSVIEEHATKSGPYLKAMTFILSIRVFFSMKE